MAIIFNFIKNIFFFADFYCLLHKFKDTFYFLIICIKICEFDYDVIIKYFSILL